MGAFLSTWLSPVINSIVSLLGVAKDYVGSLVLWFIAKKQGSDQEKIKNDQNNLVALQEAKKLKDNYEKIDTSPKHTDKQSVLDRMQRNP